MENTRQKVALRVLEDATTPLTAKQIDELSINFGVKKSKHSSMSSAITGLLRADEPQIIRYKIKGRNRYVHVNNTIDAVKDLQPIKINPRCKIVNGKFVPVDNNTTPETSTENSVSDRVTTLVTQHNALTVENERLKNRDKTVTQINEEFLANYGSIVARVDKVSVENVEVIMANQSLAKANHTLNEEIAKLKKELEAKAQYIKSIDAQLKIN